MQEYLIKYWQRDVTRLILIWSDAFGNYNYKSFICYDIDNNFLGYTNLNSFLRDKVAYDEEGAEFSFYENECIVSSQFCILNIIRTPVPGYDKPYVSYKNSNFEMVNNLSYKENIERDFPTLYTLLKLRFYG